MDFVDVIIPLGSGSRFNNRELRFALRSIERFVPKVRNIYIATDNPPKWLQNVTIVNVPDKHKHNKDANLFDKIIAVCKATDIGEYFLVWSDDQTAIDYIEPENIDIFNPRNKSKFINRNSTWAKRMVNTLDFLSSQGIELNYNWDSHTPHLYKKSVIIPILESIPYAQEPGFCLDTILMGLSKAEPKINQDTVKINAEINTPTEGWIQRSKGKLFIGYNDAAFSTGLQEELAGYLPNTSKYEKFSDSMCQGIDVVITSVNPLDFEWKKTFSKYNQKNNPEAHCRYRYFHTLQYLFRGIEQNMKWIRKVHFVISDPSQIPEWLDATHPKLHIVYHKDFIPEQLLPTFNTNHIELFLYRIEDLTEQFIYFNDDVFPVKPLKPSAFFDNEGNVRMPNYQKAYKPNTMFHKMLRNNVELLKKDYPSFIGLPKEHLTHNLLKSLFKEIVERNYSAIMEKFTTSRFRTEKDVTIHLVKNYIYLARKCTPPLVSGQYIQLSDKRSIPKTNAAIVCFNDNEHVKRQFKRIECEIIGFLDCLLPNQSKFEKKDWFLDNTPPILAKGDGYMGCGCSKKDIPTNNILGFSQQATQDVADVKPSSNDPIIQRRFWDSVQAYAAAVYDWYKHGKPNRTPEEMEHCFGICTECEHFICIDETKKRGRCGVCGCYLGVNPHRFLQGNKIAMKTQKCPEGKWE